MTTEGVDYSFGRPDPAELHRRGKRFAVRYVSWASSRRGLSVLDGGSNGKVLLRPEAERLTAAGLAIVTNWEYRHDDQLRGRAGGRDDAREAERLHRAATGAPGRPIYFSTDFDASTSQLGTCYEYLRGCADVIGWDRVGVYGGRRTIEYMKQRGVRWLWQTYAWSGLSNRFNPDDPRWVDGAQLHQYNNGVRLAGADTDLDRATTADYGQWMVGRTAPPGLEDDMDLRDTHSIPGWATKRWPELGDTVTVQTDLGGGYLYSKLAHEQLTEQAARLAGIEAAVAGEDIGPAVRAELDRHRAVLVAGLGETLGEQVLAGLREQLGDVADERLVAAAEAGTRRALGSLDEPADQEPA